MDYHLHVFYKLRIGILFERGLAQMDHILHNINSISMVLIHFSHGINPIIFDTDLNILELLNHIVFIIINPTK